MDNYYWIILIGVLIVVYVLMIVRQKRQEKRSVETLNSFKVGDKVITHIGIYGRIKRIYSTSFGKTCILEIGNDKKVDIELDMRYIAGLDEKVAVPNESSVSSEIEDKKELQTEENLNDVPAVEEKAAAPKNKKSKKSKK